MRLTHLRLLVSDHDACLKFYQEALGFDKIIGGPGQVYSELRSGSLVGDGVILALYQRRMMAAVVGTSALPSATAAQDRVVLTFEVDNVDTTYQWLREQGVECVVPPQDRREWFLRTAHFRDPDGNLIEINQPLSVEQ